VSAQYYQAIVDEAKGPSAPGSTNKSPPVVLFTVAFGAAESGRNSKPRDIGNASPFRIFLFMTNSNLAARLLRGMRFKSIGGLGTTWIRQLD